MTLQTLTDTGKQLRDSPSAKWVALLCIVAAGVFDHIKSVDARKTDAQHYQELKEQAERRWTEQHAVNNYFHGSNTVARIESAAVKK